MHTPRSFLPARAALGRALCSSAHQSHLRLLRDGAGRGTGFEVVLLQDPGVLEHASHLQHSYHSTGERDFACGVCELLQNWDLSALLTLALRYEASFTSGRVLMVGVRLPTCSTLKALTLAAIPYHDLLVSGLLPPSRLHTLQLDRCGYLSFFLLGTISEAAPSLVELTLKGTWQLLQFAPRPATPATPPNPWTLVLAGVHSCWRFCRFLELYTLQSLVLRDVELRPLIFSYNDTGKSIPLLELPAVKQLILHRCTVPELGCPPRSHNYSCTIIPAHACHYHSLLARYSGKRRHLARPRSRRRCSDASASRVSRAGSHS